MWTEEQLAEQGWSQEQIAQYRIQQDIAESPKENLNKPSYSSDSGFFRLSISHSRPSHMVSSLSSNPIANAVA